MILNHDNYLSFFNIFTNPNFKFKEEGFTGNTLLISLFEA